MNANNDVLAWEKCREEKIQLISLEPSWTFIQPVLGSFSYSYYSLFFRLFHLEDTTKVKFFIFKPWLFKRRLYGTLRQKWPSKIDITEKVCFERSSLSNWTTFLWQFWLKRHSKRSKLVIFVKNQKRVLLDQNMTSYLKNRHGTTRFFWKVKLIKLNNVFLAVLA